MSSPSHTPGAIFLEMIYEYPSLSEFELRGLRIACRLGEVTPTETIYVSVSTVWAMGVSKIDKTVQATVTEA